MVSHNAFIGRLCQVVISLDYNSAYRDSGWVDNLFACSTEYWIKKKRAKFFSIDFYISLSEKNIRASECLQWISTMKVTIMIEICEMY